VEDGIHNSRRIIQTNSEILQLDQLTYNIPNDNKQDPIYYKTNYSLVCDV